MGIKLNGATSGYVQIDAPAVAGSTQITLPATTGGSFVVSDSSGNVGIGTSSPDYKLTIQNSDAAISLKDSGGTTRAYIGVGGAFGSAPTGALRLRSDQGGIVFGYSGTEQMRLDTSSNLLVGTTSATINNSNSFVVLPSNGGAGGVTVTNHLAGSASGSVFAYYGYNGASIGGVTQNGTTGVLYNVTSDQRLKTNIVNAPSASSIIGAIQIRSFDWKSDNSHNRYGVIAQELVQIAPEAVHVPLDEADMMGVDYSKLVPIMVKAIQELSAKNDALETRLAALESK